MRAQHPVPVERVEGTDHVPAVRGGDQCPLVIDDGRLHVGERGPGDLLLVGDLVEASSPSAPGAQQRQRVVAAPARTSDASSAIGPPASKR